MSWEQLAAAVKERRIALGLTQTQVAELGGLSVELLRMVENNRTGQRLSAPKARGLERALRWESGSIAAVIAGGEPTPAATPPVAPPAAGPPMGPEPADRFAMARRVLALRRTFGDYQDMMAADAHAALAAQMAQSAREAEESIIRIMPWLPEHERGQAIDLLVELRKPLT